jgi:glycosyltransferase involved in cell wall biosynthesis
VEGKLGKTMDKVISFIQPSRNNLKYLKWSYNSIRKNLGYRHEICWADDFSDDGTWEWMNEIKEKDRNVKIHRNEGPTRLGHTILYDTLVGMASNDIVMIYHADMYACPNLDTEMLKHLERGKVVSATRIEPPLHPDGPEKILKDFGIEPEEFDEQGLLNFVSDHVGTREDETTRGIFAPWVIYKDDFQRIGGHDPLYAPQSKEDSDIFNRFVLAGYDLIQTWKGLVYHMTCRGSRFKDGALRNPAGQVFMKGRESSEWLAQNLRSTRNFIRKWGHMVKHDELMYPIIPPKYDVGFIVENCDENLLKELEPWCSNIHVTLNTEQIRNYIDKEQPDTQFNLTEKILYHSQPVTNDVIVRFDVRLLTPQNFQILVNLSEILKESGEVGEMELEIFKFKIKSLDSYERELINVI